MRAWFSSTPGPAQREAKTRPSLRSVKQQTNRTGEEVAAVAGNGAAALGLVAANHPQQLVVVQLGACQAKGRSDRQSSRGTSPVRTGLLALAPLGDGDVSAVLVVAEGDRLVHNVADQVDQLAQLGLQSEQHRS